MDGMYVPTDSDAGDASLSTVVLPLLKGVLYRESGSTTWSSLLRLQARVRDYVSVLGLDLVLDESEGFAFLRSRPSDDEGAEKLPRLVARRPLTFRVSLLLALLRKRLAEFDATGADARLVLTRDEVAEMVRIFMPHDSNEAKALERVETDLNKITDLGFVRKLKPSQGGREPSWEVLRIVKSFVDAQWLSEFDARLAEYLEHAGGGSAGPAGLPDAADEEGPMDDD